MNYLFLDALDTGTLRVPGLFWERLPAGRTLDFIGINYYTRDFVRNGGFDLPGLNAINFVLHGVLGGGGMASLHTDNLAKAYAQVLLSMEIPI